MAKPKVIVTRRWPGEVEKQLAEHFDVELNREDRPLDRAALKDALGTADALFPTVTDRIDAEVLAADPLKARFLGNFGVGFNHIDVEAAKARGITVTNTPQVLTDATADLAVTLLLMVARRAGEGERHLRAGDWSGWRPTHMVGTQVTGKTAGLIGLGRIGQAAARRLHHGFGMKILYQDPFPPPAEAIADFGAERCGTVEEVLERADFVSLHCPGGGANTHLMNAERLALMKPSAFLINSARGDVIDEAALVAALRSGQIAGAGLDVVPVEPPPRDNPLFSAANCFVTPHIAWATRSARSRLLNTLVDNVKAYLAGEPRNVVN